MEPSQSEPHRPEPTAEAPRYETILGTWQRPDGGYLLHFAGVAPDGALTAQYRNPRPVNVARAVVARTEGGLSVKVELRDENYPGSTYTLTYEAALDRLQGQYFQAVTRETFPVVFMRVAR